MEVETNTPAFPRLDPDVRAWPYFSRRSGDEGWYSIGSLRREKFILIPGKRLPVVQAVLDALDGSRPEEAIAAEIAARQKVRFDVAAFCGKLEGAGLLSASGKTPGRLEEIGKYSFDLGRAGVPLLLRAFRAVARYVPLRVLVAACGVPIIAALATIVALAGRHEPRASLHALISIQLAWSLPIVAICSLVLHEAAHLLVAAYCGLTNGRVRGQIYTVIPQVSLKLAGFCTLSPRKRLAIWSAGVYANLTAAAVALLAIAWGPAGWSGTVGSGVTHNIVAVNWLLVVMNLFPFLPTDGYYMLMTLLRKVNVRTQAIAVMGLLLNWRRARPSIVVVVYVAASLVLLGTALYSSVRNTIHGALAHDTAAALRSLAVVLVLGIVVRAIWKKGVLKKT
jgi:putative peptide zinc metalloprotease protein